LSLYRSQFTNSTGLHRILMLLAPEVQFGFLNLDRLNEVVSVGA
jgi:hypothetical protein